MGWQDHRDEGKLLKKLEKRRSKIEKEKRIKSQNKLDELQKEIKKLENKITSKAREKALQETEEEIQNAVSGKEKRKLFSKKKTLKKRINEQGEELAKLKEEEASLKKKCGIKEEKNLQDATKNAVKEQLQEQDLDDDTEENKDIEEYDLTESEETDVEEVYDDKDKEYQFGSREYLKGYNGWAGNDKGLKLHPTKDGSSSTNSTYGRVNKGLSNRKKHLMKVEGIPFNDEGSDEQAMPNNATTIPVEDSNIVVPTGMLVDSIMQHYAYY